MNKPNFLLITGDHVRCDALSCFREFFDSPASISSVSNTPNLDSLASRSVRFRNCYSPDPICVPARAAITTGRYPHKCAVSKTNKAAIHKDETVLAGHFAENGYRTIAIGKLHYSPYSPPGQPRLLHGFQHAELCEEGRYISKYDPTGELRGLEEYHDFLYDVGWGGYERSHCIGNNDVGPAPTPLPEEYHEEAWVASRVDAMLGSHVKESPDQPFLMWASFTKPHPPFDPPWSYAEKLDPRDMPEPLGNWDDSMLDDRDAELRVRKYHYGWERLSVYSVKNIRAYYCAMMTFQDAMIGRILDTLKQNGLDKNTIIAYTADHGELLGDFGRFFKTNMFDAAANVPLILHVPKELLPDGTAGDARTHLVGLQDLFPTFCSLAGVEAPAGQDGIDLTPILKSPDAPDREFIISQTNDHPTQKYMLRTPRWKYVYTQAGGIEELYDSERGGEYELHNLATSPEHAEILAELREKLTAWCRENGDTNMLEDGKLKVSDISAAGKPVLGDRLGTRQF